MENKSVINDRVFGEMKYNYGWCKPERITFCDKEFTVVLCADAYSGKRITEEQRQSFQRFDRERMSVLRGIAERIMDFVNANLPAFSESWADAEKITDIRDLPKIVSPRTLLFQRDGEAIILFDCAWDEHGLGVQFYPDYRLGTQDIFL